ncbi:MAG: sialidase family protein [Nitrososphaeraceae archaeon]
MFTAFISQISDVSGSVRTNQSMVNSINIAHMKISSQTSERGIVVNLSNNTTGRLDFPDVAVYRKDIYIVWADNSHGNYDIYLTKSTDGGTSFSDPVNLSNNIGHTINPSIIASENDVYVVLSDNSTGNYDIYLMKSTDGGITFSGLINLSNNTGLSDFPEMAVVGNGINKNVYVTWVDNSGTNYDIYLIKSTDGGTSFGRAINLSTTGALSDFPEIVVTTNEKSNVVYIAWVEKIPEYMSRVLSATANDEIFFVRSTHEDTAFSDPNNLSNNPSVSTDPQLAISNSSVYVVWYDEKTSKNGEILFTRSNNYGVNFDKITNLSSNTGSSYQPDITACGSNVYVVWSGQNDLQTFDIFLSKSGNNGDTFDETINVSSNSEFSKSPRIAVSESCKYVYVVWIEDFLEGDEIFLQKMP